MSDLLEYQKRNIAYRRHLSDEYSKLTTEFHKLSELSEECSMMLKSAIKGIDSRSINEFNDKLEKILCDMDINEAKRTTIQYALDLHQKIVK